MPRIDVSDAPGDGDSDGVVVGNGDDVGVGSGVRVSASDSPLASNLKFDFEHASGEMEMLVADFECMLDKDMEDVRRSNSEVPTDKMMAAVVTALGNVMRRTSSTAVRVIPMLSLDNLNASHVPVRVYMDGCFDIMHSGHFNAIRQAKSLGDVLVVGVHSDAEIRKHKGPPVMNEQERMAAVKDCKWIDEVVFDTPYNPSLKLLDSLNCDFCVHGDDMPSSANGTHAYTEVERAGRLRVIKRTEGVSTTDLLGRLLLMTKDHHLKRGSLTKLPTLARDRDGGGHSRNISGFLPTTWRISQFANNRTPNENDVIVYIAGSFDLLHVGHIESLKQARSLGDFLYVGVHDDETVNRQLGNNYPIMNLHERVLNVLSCRWVDEVILGAPRLIGHELIKTLNISVVISEFNLDGVAQRDMAEQLQVPVDLGIVKAIDSSHLLRTRDVVRRIVENRLKYEERNSSRVQQEQEHMESRSYVAEL